MIVTDKEKEKEKSQTSVPTTVNPTGVSDWREIAGRAATATEPLVGTSAGQSGRDTARVTLPQADEGAGAHIGREARSDQVTVPETGMAQSSIAAWLDTPSPSTVETRPTDPPDDPAVDAERDMDAMIEEAVREALGYASSSFTYNKNNDPLYRSYADTYARAAREARDDTYARIAAGTGGFGSSYAGVAAEQAYNRQMEGMDDILPALYQYAYERQQGKESAAKEALSDRISLLQAWRDDTEAREAAEQEKTATNTDTVLSMLESGMDDEGIAAYLTGMGWHEEDVTNALTKAQDAWRGGYGAWYRAQEEQADTEALQNETKEAAAAAETLLAAGLTAAEVRSILTRSYQYSEAAATAAVEGLSGYYDRLHTGESQNGMSAYAYVQDWMDLNLIDSLDGRDREVKAVLAAAGYTQEEIAEYERLRGQMAEAKHADVYDQIQTAAQKDMQDLLYDYEIKDISAEDAVSEIASMVRVLDTYVDKEQLTRTQAEKLYQSLAKLLERVCSDVTYMGEGDDPYAASQERGGLSLNHDEKNMMKRLIGYIEGEAWSHTRDVLGLA